jgi:hypothetical protein
MTRLRPGLLAIVAALLVSGCNQAEVFTLYRNSVTSGGEAMRIHLASFDADNGPDYNRQNCEIARELFQGQAGVRTKFWCEKGRFKS